MSTLNGNLEQEVYYVLSIVTLGIFFVYCFTKRGQVQTNFHNLVAWANSMQVEKANLEFSVADISLATFGKKEIEIAEHEMPGLMAIRESSLRANHLTG